jgi:hypothetical protein
VESSIESVEGIETLLLLKDELVTVVVDNDEDEDDEDELVDAGGLELVLCEVTDCEDEVEEESEDELVEEVVVVLVVEAWLVTA